jgi:hypothetical protein
MALMDISEIIKATQIRRYKKLFIENILSNHAFARYMPRKKATALWVFCGGPRPRLRPRLKRNVIEQLPV